MQWKKKQKKLSRQKKVPSVKVIDLPRFGKMAVLVSALDREESYLDITASYIHLTQNGTHCFTLRRILTSKWHCWNFVRSNEHTNGSHSKKTLFILKAHTIEPTQHIRIQNDGCRHKLHNALLLEWTCFKWSPTSTNGICTENWKHFVSHYTSCLPWPCNLTNDLNFTKCSRKKKSCRASVPGQEWDFELVLVGACAIGGMRKAVGTLRSKCTALTNISRNGRRFTSNRPQRHQKWIKEASTTQTDQIFSRRPKDPCIFLQIRTKQKERDTHEIKEEKDKAKLTF